MDTVEYQKRGLPHVHIDLWTVESQENVIDHWISAEIPNPLVDPILYRIITKCNLHKCKLGRCKVDASSECNTNFPMPFRSRTRIVENNYPQYKRLSPSEGGHTYKNRPSSPLVDNRYVVPYNPSLSQLFNCHINVEVCRNIRSIYYILKYVTKGHDMATFVLERENDAVDEIIEYLNGRYMSSMNAAYHIHGFAIHRRWPAVLCLPLHLENEQRIYFDVSIITLRNLY